MKRYLMLLLVFFLALLQGAFLPLNLVLLAVLIWTVLKSAKESLIVSFLAGLFLDLAKGTPLGISSFMLLAACYLLLLYRRKLDPLHPLFLPIFVFLSANAYSFTINHFFNWPEGLILGVLAFLARLMVKRFSVRFGGPEIRLKI